LYADGTIQSQNKFQKIVNGETLLPEVAMDGSPGGGVKSIRLGDETLASGSGVVFGSIVKNGNKIEYTNPAGKLLKWSEQGTIDIANSINSAKNSGNAGKIVEANVAKFLQQEGKKIEGYGLEIKRANNTVAGDIDIITSNELIEVKNSYSAWSGKKDQISKLANSSLDDFMNPNNKKVILYIEQPLSILDKSNILNYIPSDVILVNSLDELKSVIK